MSKRHRWAVVGLWVIWVVVLLTYQFIATNRFEPNRPDEAVGWSKNETARNSQKDKPYLIDPFMNEHVSWDAEFYLSIAIAGYDDPEVRWTEVKQRRELALNYAFFPGYPYVIRAVSVPLSALGMTPIATATLAGVLISILGTLAALYALYELVIEELGEAGALRTAFYLLIFPTSFYFMAVFTEGLFLALALWCLVMVKRRNWLLAGVFAAFATWTRATGLLLIIPIGLGWLEAIGWRNVFALNAWRKRDVLFVVAAVLLPLGAYLLWNVALGEQFHLIEDSWFGRSLSNFERTLDGWENAIKELTTSEFPERRIYYMLEFGAVGLAVVMALYILPRYPGIALFSLAALALGALTSAPQSLVRYVLTTPALFIGLGRLGKNSFFDRAWTMFSLLLLAMQMFLFANDMWTA